MSRGSGSPQATAPSTFRMPPKKNTPSKTVKVAVKRERSPSLEDVAAASRESRVLRSTCPVDDEGVSSSGTSNPSSVVATNPHRGDGEDVYKTLARRMGGQELFSFTDNEDKTTPKTAVSIADVIPYMWKEKPLDATLKKLIKDAKAKHKSGGPFSELLVTQIGQLNRMFSIMWNDCVFSGLSAEETLSKVSLDPQAWAISETAMEIVLQAKYPQETLETVQKALKRFKSMVPLEMLFNPRTRVHWWEMVAYLTETYFIDCEASYEANCKIEDLYVNIATLKREHSTKVSELKSELDEQIEVAEALEDDVAVLKERVTKKDDNIEFLRGKRKEAKEKYAQLLRKYNKTFEDW